MAQEKISVPDVGSSPKLGQPVHRSENIVGVEDHPPHRNSNRRIHSLPSSSLRHQPPHHHRSQVLSSAASPAASTLDRSTRDKDDPYYLAMPENPMKQTRLTDVPSASNPLGLGYIEPRLERTRTMRPLSRSSSTSIQHKSASASGMTVPAFDKSSPKDTLPQSPEHFFAAVFGNSNAGSHMSSPSSSSISSIEEDEDRKFRPTSLTSLSSMSSVSSSEQQQQQQQQFTKSFSLHSAHNLRRSSLLQSNGNLPSAPLSLKADRRQSVTDVETLVCVVIESEFTKWQCLNAEQRPATLRHVLFNVLHRPVSNNVTPATLFRRCTDLLLWWANILKLFRFASLPSYARPASSSSPSSLLSNADRPLYFEFMRSIICLPEWRMLSLSFNRSRVTQLDDVFLQKTVGLVKQYQYQLYDTLDYVIDRLSCRTVPGYLSDFAANVMATSFFALPGVGIRLLHLLNIPKLRLSQFLSERDLKISEVTAAGARSVFPVHLHDLISASPYCVYRHSVTEPLSLNLTVDSTLSIDFSRPWARLWQSYDGGIFFHFLRYFHGELLEYLVDAPPPLMSDLYLATPGLLLLYSRALDIADYSVHVSAAQSGVIDDGPTRFPVQKKKHAAVRNSESYKQVANDSMHAVALSLLTADERSHRSLIVLKKLSSTFGQIFRICGARIRHSDYVSSRHILGNTIATNIECLLKVAVKRTSVHDGASCATLCQFMELALPILADNCMDFPDRTLDWTFWIDILKRLVDSQYMTTQIRALSTLYNIWDIFPHKLEIRKSLAHWLLADATFARLFLHYSSWVRCFYMHVVCWRLAQWIHDPLVESLYLQFEIERLLQSCISKHDLMKEKAIREHRESPSSLPSTPLPNRRMAIVRYCPLSDVSAGLYESTLDKLVLSDTASADSSEEDVSTESLLLRSSSTSSLRSLSLKDSSRFTASLKKRLDSFTKSFRSDAPTLRPVTKIPVEQPLFEKPASMALSFALRHYQFIYESVTPRSPEEFRLISQTERPPALILPHFGIPSSSVEGDTSEVNVDDTGAKYSGRALSEWAETVDQCNLFFTRRRKILHRASDEGLVTLSDIAVPKMSFGI